MKVKELNVRIVEFFEKWYGIDVSNIEVVYDDFDAAGKYDIFDFNKIYISNKIKGKGLAEETVAVHEINHLLQHEHNIGLTLTKDIVFNECPHANYDYLDIVDIDALYYEKHYGQAQSVEDVRSMNQYIADNYWSKHIEIDSRLVEGLYVYEECGLHALEIIIDHIFRCGVIGNLKTRIKNMPNSMAKMCLLEEYKKREEELMNISNSDCLFGELNIEDLLA